MRPLKRLLCAVYSGLTVVPVSQPTSVVSSAEKMKPCVRSTRPWASGLPSQNSETVPPLPNPPPS